MDFEYSEEQKLLSDTLRRFLATGYNFDARAKITTSAAGFSEDVWAALAYSTLFVAAFGFAAWQGGISRIGANRVLVYQYLIVLTGVASGVVFFGENLGANKLLGGAIILVGVYLARRQ